MAKKISSPQLSFLPQLDIDEPLLPFVVLPTDERWDNALQELQSCNWFGLDTEFWEDAWLRDRAVRSSRTLNPRANFDDWSTRLRLIQVGLPSGLVMIADFGLETPSLPIPIPGHRLEKFLLVLGRKLRCRKTSKFGQTLNTEARILRRHFGFVLRRVRDTMLASQVVYAGVGSKAFSHTEYGRVKRTKLRHRLADIADRVGVTIDKTEQLSDWSAPRLSNKQLNYAAKDVYRDTLLACWSALAKKAKQDGVWSSVLIECDAAPAFYECEWRGMTFDKAETEALIAAYEKTADDCFETLRRFLGQLVMEGPGSKESLPIALTKWLHDGLLQARLANECEQRALNAPEGQAKALRETAAQHRSAPYFWSKQKFGQKIYECLESMAPEEAREKDFEKEALVLYRWEQKKTKVVRSGLSMTPEEAKAEGFSLQPEMSETQLSAFDKLEPVIALLEGRSCRNTASVLQGRLNNAWSEGDKDTWLCTACGHWVETPYHCGEPAIVGAVAGRLAARCKYWQIAGNEDDSGAGTGRSSSSDPFNAQNLTSYPLGENRQKEELKLPSARSGCKPQPGRSMYVGDFSQAHMRFAAQESLDEGLCDDFRAGRDAHIRLATSLAREQGDDTAEFGAWCLVYQKGDKKDPVYTRIKKVRQPAKVGNYTCLCFGGIGSMAKSAATDRDPIHLPEEVWFKTREAWRKTYDQLYACQKLRIKEANANSCTFDDIGESGEYGYVWSVNRDRRVYHLKEWNTPLWAGAEGRYSCKGTELIASIWQMSEANALKDALARILERFDEHPEWQALIENAVHDEVDAESSSEFVEQVSTVVFEEMKNGLVRAGITAIPVTAPGDCAAKLVVKSWADK